MHTYLGVLLSIGLRRSAARRSALRASARPLEIRGGEAIGRIGVQLRGEHVRRVLPAGFRGQPQDLIGREALAPLRHSPGCLEPAQLRHRAVPIQIVDCLRNDVWRFNVTHPYPCNCLPLVRILLKVGARKDFLTGGSRFP